MSATPKQPGQLLVDGNGQPRPLVANAITALRDAVAWQGVLAWNEFGMRTVAVRPTPWGHSGEWRDEDDIQTAAWLQQRRIRVGVELASQAVKVVAAERLFHPVRAYLSGLSWDQQKRLDTWLETYLGVELSEFERAVAPRWAISAVARIMKPGCKVDTCLVAEGPQGTLKSSAFRALGEPWFSDDWRTELDSKDSSMAMAGVWIFEIPEFDRIKGVEASRVKALLSRQVERYRPPYGRRVIEQPRQCIFVGTANHSNYLTDETGGRRIWPITCGRIDLEALRRDRDQLWAEAVDRFNLGEAWWLDSPDLERAAGEEQSQRYDEDPWHEEIRAWIELPTAEPGSTEPFNSKPESVTIADVLAHCIGTARHLRTQSDQRRVARTLAALGWERHKRPAHPGEAKRLWAYRPKPQ